MALLLGAATPGEFDGGSLPAGALGARPCHFLTVGPWESCLASLNLIFLTYSENKMR